MTSSVAESEKALRYIHALDAARAHGQWHQVPELARKVEKHAPHRKTLAVTARSEASAATTAINDAPNALRLLIAPLVDTITKPNSHVEDTFQATVCLAWLHWILQEQAEALAQLVEEPSNAYSQASSKATQATEWVQICAIKYAYLKGFCLEKTGSSEEAGEAYGSVMPLLSDISSRIALGSMPREFRLWAERLLSRCIAHSFKTNPLKDGTDYGKLLRIFHHWASLFNFYPTDPKTASHAPSSQTSFDFELGLEVEYSRWDMWMSYYSTLSQILKRGYVYSISYSDSNPQIFVSPADYSSEEFRDARLKQRKELKNVESRIETKLLEETSFPKAQIRNDRVERWADAVMDNWKVMCGPGWHDVDLGEGGKNAIAKGVLDILYRAATKTFHSTKILRHLFTVHAYLAEFDLAVRSLDAYLELFSRGKARAEKSGEPDFGLDHQDKALWILSEAVSILCQFGRRKEAEKAKELAEKLRSWTEEWDVEPQIQEAAETTLNGNIVEHIDKSVSPTIIALAYHALGISEAHWARITYEAATRSQHQNKALEYFRLALHRKYRNSRNLDYMYSLAVLLAEMRDISGSTKVVKQALAETSQHEESNEESYEKERKLVRFWHLLTLLLSSRSDLLNAAKASNAAFEQFQDPGILFGQQEYRSEHLNDSEKIRNVTPALIDHMNAFEKVGVLQVKMTQVALLEALEGPGSAIEASLDLLAIYSRLFGSPKDYDTPQTSSMAKAPKSRVGSLRTSIFRRSKSRKADGRNTNTGVPQTANTRPFTAATSTTAPTIQVTDTSHSLETRGRTMNGTSARPRTSIQESPRSTDRSMQRSRSRGKIQKRQSMRNSLESFRPVSPTTEYDDKQIENSPPNGTTGNGTTGNGQGRASVQSSQRPDTSLSTATGTTINALPHRNSKRDSLQTVRTTISHAGTIIVREGSPAPSFPNLTDRRHKLSVLVELWLFVAGMYVRSELFDDAKDSINEAANLVSGFEQDVSTTSATARAFSDPGWGGGKSVDEMWGDIWAQRGELARSRSLPHEALGQFEKALGYWPNHARAIVGLSDILLDIYTEQVPPDPPQDPLPGFLPSGTISPGATSESLKSPMTPAALSAAPSIPSLSRNPTAQSFNTGTTSGVSQNGAAVEPDGVTDHSEEGGEGSAAAQDTPIELAPDVLNRLAARDRAYFLLSTLTKLGPGWDYSEAWYALARVYEESGQVEKAKEVLWWCVELEDSRPLRPWGCAGLSGLLF